MRKLKSLIFLFVLAAAICGCGSQQNSNNEELQKQLEELQKANEELSNRLDEMQNTTVAPTATLVPTATSTPVPTATNTPVPTATSAPIPTATSTPVPTATNTPIPTATSTPVPTATPTPTYTFKEIEEVMYAEDTINVRNKPSADGKKIGSLTRGDVIWVLRQCAETGWYEIDFDGGIGYVSNQYVSTKSPFPKDDMTMDVSQNEWTVGEETICIPITINENGYKGPYAVEYLLEDSNIVSCEFSHSDELQLLVTGIKNGKTTISVYIVGTDIEEKLEIISNISETTEIISDEDLAAYAWIAMEEYVYNNNYFGDIEIYGIYKCVDRDGSSVKCVGFECAWGEKNMYVAACLKEGTPTNYQVFTLHNMVIRGLDDYYINGIGGSAFDQFENFDKYYYFGDMLDYYEIRDLYREYKIEENYRFLY